MNVLDLFSGIGGFSLGLERAGMRTVAFCEIEPYCRAVLAKHWPGVPCYDDIRTLSAERLRANGISVDVICGGFPCQDVSVAGRRAGMDGARSGLWSEYARIIGELRPQYVIVENTPGLLSLGMGAVLGDLAALGYDAEWHCIPASYLGARHIRDRVWIVADDQRVRELQQEGREPDQRGWADHSAQEDATDADGSRLQKRLLLTGIQSEAQRYVHGQDASLDPWRTSEPALVRALHGIPGRTHRIKSLGNAVVPQIPEIIGRAIMSAKLTSQQRAGEKP